MTHKTVKASIMKIRHAGNLIYKWFILIFSFILFHFSSSIKSGATTNPTLPLWYINKKASLST
jgi:hypothetical protein